MTQHQLFQQPCPLLEVSQGDDQDEYNPDGDDEDTYEEDRQDYQAGDGISTRTRSSRSDRSPEEFRRNNALRRPLVRAWNDFNMQNIEDLPSSAARRSNQ